ncbi:hypothetical protein L7F22_031506 [Adiantum nelumboides]|nr:hypothetical protein [Adiantum nelumboides]
MQQEEIIKQVNELLEKGLVRPRTSPYCSPVLLVQKKDGTFRMFVEVDLSDIRKDVQCPICLGIIRKTRTVMECLHRFCRECIDKSMRLGNNECPVCRTHCASRRSLRDDLNFDALIAALYPNVDSYEEEEFALREENERRNKQLQQSIAETLERQSDAITRRCTTSKITASTGVRKTQTKFRDVEHQNKGKQSQNYRADDEDYMEEFEQTAAPETATRDRRTRRRKRETTTLQLEATDDEQGDVQANKSSRLNSSKTNDDAKGETSGGNVGRLEGLATWARAGSRSTARYGNLNNSNNRLIARATMLLEALSAATQMERDIEFDVHLILQPFVSDDDDDNLPSLDKPHICCPANVTVQHVCEFVVNRLPIDPDEQLELILGSNEGQDLYMDSKSNLSKQKGVYDGTEGFKVPEILHPQATLGQIHEILWHCHGNLVLLYRRRI